MRTASTTTARGRGSVSAPRACAYSRRADGLCATSRAATAPANSSSRPRLLFAASKSPFRIHATAGAYPAKQRESIRAQLLSARRVPACATRLKAPESPRRQAENVATPPAVPGGASAIFELRLRGEEIGAADRRRGCASWILARRTETLGAACLLLRGRVQRGAGHGMDLAHWFRDACCPDQVVPPVRLSAPLRHRLSPRRSHRSDLSGHRWRREWNWR